MGILAGLAEKLGIKGERTTGTGYTVLNQEHGPSEPPVTQGVKVVDYKLQTPGGKAKEDSKDVGGDRKGRDEQRG